ncbi:MAG: hypothetical protein IKJ68_08320 [Clostridia bacterium]|nr:hypothetical protein [Clostridia bacterium]
MQNLPLPKDKSILSKELKDLVSLKEYIDLAEEHSRDIDAILISLYEVVHTTTEVLQQAQLLLNTLIMDNCF